jgi:hypothetical protein
MLQIVPDEGSGNNHAAASHPVPAPADPGSGARNLNPAEALMRKMEDMKKKKDLERRIKREKRIAERMQGGI